MNAICKVGDSFTVPIQFYDTKTGQGMLLTDDMKFSAHIVNSSQQIIAIPMISVLWDVVGMILLEVPISVTREWKTGTAQLDIKLEMNGNVRHSQNIQFQIQRSITL